MKYKSDMNYLANEISQWRAKKGFKTSWRNMPEKLMLVVTELSEAMEDYRKGKARHFHEEIADAMIRLLDICGSLKIDIESEIERKMIINEGRPIRHGKKL